MVEQSTWQTNPLAAPFLVTSSTISKGNLSFILRKPAGNNELVIVEPNLVHEVVQNRFTHIWVVQIRVKILVEICLNAVLVFVQRLPDKFGFDCFRQRVFSS